MPLSSDLVTHHQWRVGDWNRVLSMRPDTIEALAGGFNGATVLVTGGCGFIGSHLVETLVSVGSSCVGVGQLAGQHPG